VVGNIRQVRRLVDRIRALEHGVHDSIAERREEFAGGVAYFNDELRLVWDLNFVRLDRPCESPSLWADRLQAGLGHRKVVVEEPRLVARFGPGLRERGYGEQELVALTREPGGVRDPDVRVVEAREIEELLRRVNAEQDAVRTPELVEQLVCKSLLDEERAGGRWLALFAGERAVAHCVLFSNDGLMQIEDVGTPAAYQRQGCARRLLEHALELARVEHDTVYIQAHADDWPLGFYERLGFVPLERRANYVLIVAEG
jgi:GNAT superfamily N-acetyltransferase